MTNTQIATAFANGDTKGKALNMFIDDRAIYSYGYHFPIAYRGYSKDKMFFNQDRYSRSTGKQQGIVRRAIEAKGYTISLIDTNELKILIGRY